MKKWYEIQNRAGESPGIEVSIYDEIGIWGVSAADFIRDLRAVDDGMSPIVVAINSPGGNVFDGIALNAFLSRLGDRCAARIDGIAASAASVVAVGASRVQIGESAMMMIHQPWQIAAGNAEDFRKLADDLDKVGDSVRAAYQRKAPGIEDEDLSALLDDETWLSAKEAVELGLADEIVERASVKACRGAFGLLERYGKLPRALAEPEPAPAEPEPEPPEPEPEPEPPNPGADESGAELAAIAAQLASACVKAGVSQLTEHIIMSTSKTKEAADAEVARIEAIASLCVAARRTELAALYIQSRLSAEEARARLFDEIVARNDQEIDNKTPENLGNAAAAKVSAKDIYARRKTTSSKTTRSKTTKAKGA
ncbi:MAG: ATP-dependent Clp protease proteolytic subunit [Zoogloeaceae bacterium]|jgi:ATP-dependent protease ClpP protease subunit|nr:ATP-dependent Clp protease proteolytic subunit [Zoogloeaceae bacterium]